MRLRIQLEILSSAAGAMVSSMLPYSVGEPIAAVWDRDHGEALLFSLHPNGHRVCRLTLDREDDLHLAPPSQGSRYQHIHLV